MKYATAIPNHVGAVIAMDSANRPLDYGKKRTKAQWFSWATRNCDAGPGFTVVVSQFHRDDVGPYVRIHLAGMPLRARS